MTYLLVTRPKDSHVSSDRLQEIGIDISWTSLNEWMTQNSDWKKYI